MKWQKEWSWLQTSAEPDQTHLSRMMGQVLQVSPLTSYLKKRSSLPLLLCLTTSMIDILNGDSTSPDKLWIRSSCLPCLLDAGMKLTIELQLYLPPLSKPANSCQTLNFFFFINNLIPRSLQSIVCDYFLIKIVFVKNVGESVEIEAVSTWPSQVCSRSSTFLL